MEIMCMGNCTEGSNPSLSAKNPGKIRLRRIDCEALFCFWAQNNNFSKQRANANLNLKYRLKSRCAGVGTLQIITSTMAKS